MSEELRRLFEYLIENINKSEWSDRHEELKEEFLSICDEIKSKYDFNEKDSENSMLLDHDAIRGNLYVKKYLDENKAILHN